MSINTNTTNIQKTIEEQVFDVSDYDPTDIYSPLDIVYNQSSLIGTKPNVIITQQTTSPAGYRIRPYADIGARPIFDRYIPDEDVTPIPEDAIEFIKPYSEEDKVNDRECHPINWNSSCKY